VVFVRDHALQGRAFAMEPADYAEGSLVEGEGNSTFDSLGDGYLQIGPEMSAPSRGVVVWAILKELGVEGVRDRVSRHCSFARRVFELASADERLEPLSRPTLSICCYRYRAQNTSESMLDELNTEIARRLRIEGIVPSTTRVDGNSAVLHKSAHDDRGGRADGRADSRHRRRADKKRPLATRAGGGSPS
jgi:aromatic-L-amino-acid decarboxylase